MKVESLPVDKDGNGARLRTLTFDEADALMLANAMLIASNTAMMGQADKAQARLNHYRDQFLALCPAEARLFRKGTDVAEIAIAMATAPSWRVTRERPTWRSFGGTQVVVHVQDAAWHTSDDADDETYEAICRMLENIAPMSCVRECNDTAMAD